MTTRIRGRALLHGLMGAGLALACASSPSPSPRSASSHEVLHEGFGVHVDLEGWQVYRDADSAPAPLRPAFASKRGPDDPPLFVAMRDESVFMVLVQRGIRVDAQGFFDRFAAGVEQQGEVMTAARLPASDDIVLVTRIGSGAFATYSRVLVHVAEGRLVQAMLTGRGRVPSEEAFADMLRRIQLDGEGGWETTWDLQVPIAAEALAGYAGHAEPEDPFQAVECAPGRHPLLWVVPAADGGRLYLFGSIHVGHASFYPFASPIEEAFEAADRLVVEVDTGASTEADILQRAFQPGATVGPPLADVVSPEVYARVGEAARDLGIPPQVFDSLSPGAAGLVLSLAPLLVRGFDPAAGVERYFLERAQDKQLLALETASEQMALIESFDESFLQASLDGLRTIDADLDVLHRAWRCGDEEALGRTLFDLSRERAETPEERAEVEHLHEVFLYRRNRTMARRIQELLAAGGNSFVVVGAAHLVREQSIPSLLRAAGHPVERIGP